jgi:hypothetical protein
MSTAQTGLIIVLAIPPLSNPADVMAGVVG